jgi:hypothetical protein
LGNTVEATLKKPNENVNSNCMNEIVNFLESTRYAKFEFDQTSLKITQNEDKKAIAFKFADVEKVLSRTDYDGSQFIQINFHNRTKILITKNLIGFKPLELVGFDPTKIPKVVTTVDLNSVFKAIEDLTDGEDTYQTATELEVLKKVYQSIMLGAEQVGFEMKSEKQWFSAYLLNPLAATA